jgi:glutamyl-tRNA(Gln) amidotransferase subunit E
VPRIPRIPRLTYYEAMRQWNLLRLKDELASRGVVTETFAASAEEITKVLRRALYQPLQSAVAAGMTVHGVRLGGFKGLLRWQTQTDTVFSREISDRVRVIACLTVLPNIAHSDSFGETLASSEWTAVRKALGAGPNDTMVVVWGPDADAKLGAQEIIARAREATIGVPSETRQAFGDGTNGFERILPGPDRMYPDTDLPPKRIPPERLERVRASLPPHILTREGRYRELGVPEDLVARLAASPFAPLFEQAVGEWGVKPALAAVVLVQYPRRLKRRGLPVDRLDAATIEAVLRALGGRRLYKEGVLPLLERVLSAGGTVSEALPPVADAEGVIAGIRGATAVVKGLRFRREPARALKAMGFLMASLRGRADGAELAARLDGALQGAAE